MSVLAQIHSFEDFKKVPVDKFEELAKEIREFLIDNVSKTGGHLAPNLGTVELTLALLHIYNPPEDKIIWDVGHQSYVYKILTGRKDKFNTLRQFDGISGFPRRTESEYDFWGTGHASTAISAALGFAISRDILGKDYHIVAVVGDGALTGGLAFEGLNNAGASHTEMLVVLNDNAMSISPNVGAISRYLTEIVASPLYQKAKANIWNWTEQVGEVGKHIRTIARRLEDSFKNLLVPGMLFEQLGFDYYGPIDGHNITELLLILREIKNIKKPKLLHILTTKGKGFPPAEKDATTFHGLGKFDPETGEEIILPQQPPTYTKIFGLAMSELGERFPDLCAVTAAMTTGTGLNDFAKKFPRRFFDVGIAEGHAILFASSLAINGNRTVSAIYSTFVQRAYDQIIHDVALQKAPLVIALDRAGIVGEDGPTHHGTFDISFLRPVPNWVITAPKDGIELRNLLFTALKRFSEPWVIRFPRGNCPSSEIADFEEIELGSWEILRQGDGKILILAVGSMVQQSMEASIILEKSGIRPTVVNCRFIKPIDEKMLLDLAKSHDAILTIEEGISTGGFGEGISAYLAARGFPSKRIFIHAIPDKFIEHGARNLLLEKLFLSPSGIADVIEKFLASK